MRFNGCLAVYLMNPSLKKQLKCGVLGEMLMVWESTKIMCPQKVFITFSMMFTVSIAMHIFKPFVNSTVEVEHHFK